MDQQSRQAGSKGPRHVTWFKILFDSVNILRGLAAILTGNSEVSADVSNNINHTCVPGVQMQLSLRVGLLKRLCYSKPGLEPHKVSVKRGPMSRMTRMSRQVLHLKTFIQIH